MIRIIDVTYYTHQEYTQPEQVLVHHKHALGFVYHIKNLAEIRVIKHLNFEGEQTINGVKFSFFRSRNKFFHVPLRTHKHIKQQKPDVILIQGLCFPVQVIFLRLAIGGKCKILVQHHAERPFSGIRGIFQKIASYCIDGYLFTTTGNAKPWKDARRLPPRTKLYEVLEGASYLQARDKAESREKTGMKNGNNFLWVGRLDANKDPLTILLGFERYVQTDPSASLYMIYQEDDLLDEVKALITLSPALKNSVHLIGKVPNEELAWWYSAADFYLSGSHREGSGFALIESMNCGCIPIVTNIPSFSKIAGSHGLFFVPGDPESLYHMLLYTAGISKPETSAAILSYAKEKLSFEAIANDTFKAAVDISGISYRSSTVKQFH